jgi:superfamily II DNA or RNA helicase
VLANMKFAKQFQMFLQEYVNINKTRMDELDRHVRALRDYLYGHAVFGDILIDMIPQGSWAHKTIVKPMPGKEFDADVLLQIRKPEDWEPADYVSKLWSAFRDSGVYREKVSRKARCVRVQYAGECHVDVVPFIRSSSGGQITNRDYNSFESADPTGFTAWFKERNNTTGGHLKRVIRLVKYLRNYKGVFSIKSVILTTLLAERVHNTALRTDPACYADVPSTLKALMLALADHLDTHDEPPTVVDPSDITCTFNHRWDPDTYPNLRTRIRFYANKIAAAYDEEDQDRSMALWREVFGPEFGYVSLTQAAAKMPPLLRFDTDGSSNTSEIMTERTIASHQRRALERLMTWWRSRSPERAHGFIAMPTGSGKTFTAVTFAVNEILAKRKRSCVVWVAHNEFLLNQAQEEFERQLRAKGLHNEIELGRARGDGRGCDANIILAMIQTLARGDAITAIKRAGDVDLVIFDEFHRLAADTWREVPRKFQRARIRTLGLSATPFRKTAEKTELLRQILPHRIYSVGYTELVRDRFLADPILIRVEVKNPRPIELSTSEFAHLRQFRQLNQSVLDKIANQVGRDQLIVDTYKRDPGRFGSTIVFCCSVDHAEHLAQEFRRNRIDAESICGSSKDPANQENLARFARREFPIATSVLLLTEGVNIPICRTVFLARPSESPVLVAQMIGRAMRGQKAGGAATCNIVDFVDNLANGLDLAASHFAFVRDSDERLRPLVRRPPKDGACGVSAALLLRVREFLNERVLRDGGVASLGQILREEVAGWLEYWDGQIHRILLVPHGHGQEILEAFEDAQSRARDLEPGDVQAGAAELARAAYDDHTLDVYGVSEEDFVAMAVAGANEHHNLHAHALEGPNAIQKDEDAIRGASQALNELEDAMTTSGAVHGFSDAFAALRAALRSRG